MQLKMCLLTMGFAVGLGLLTSPANATLVSVVSLTTGPIHADSGVTNLSCQVTNVSSANIPYMQVTIFNKEGVVLKSSGAMTLAPNRTFQIYQLNYSGMGYCKISITALASTSQIRGNIQTHRWMGTYWKAVNYDTAK